MILVSQGAEIIRMKKEKVEEFSDEAALTKLSNLKIKYPRYLLLTCGSSLGSEGHNLLS